MATSGTISQYPYSNRKILDRSFGRANIAPQKITAEAIAIATDMLYSMCTEYINAGFPLWTKQFSLLSTQVGSPDVTTPTGTVDAFHVYWRILQPYRGAATLSTGFGDDLLFAGQPNDDVAIAGPNPSVAVNFTSDAEVDTIGVLMGNVTAASATLNVQTSTDGTTWTTVQTLPTTTYEPLTWAYFDLDPTITAQYVRLQNPISGTWTLNQLNFGLANGQDIELGQLSLDNYYNLPNKKFQSGRPNSVYIDRQNPVPILRIWPTPNEDAFYNGTVTCVLRRYIQDPGTMTNMLDVPVRWIEAVQWRLAHRIITGIPDELLSGQKPDEMTALKLQMKQQIIDRCDANATKAELLAWAEERTRGPIQLYPNLGCYTG